MDWEDGIAMNELWRSLRDYLTISVEGVEGVDATRNRRRGHSHRASGRSVTTSIRSTSQAWYPPP